MRNSPKKRICVLISGRGSNLKSLIRAAQSYEIIAVLSDRPEAGGLNFAKEANIPVYAYSRKEYPKISDLKKAIFQQIATLQPDLIVLAGFMLILPPEVIEAWPKKIINIHPALLPKFPGINTHERAIEAKEEQHGCTVHYVDAGVDTGEIIEQASLAVLPSDDSHSLAQRVLQLEHELFPRVINRLCQAV